jgi:hypothetical protein
MWTWLFGPLEYLGWIKSQMNDILIHLECDENVRYLQWKVMKIRMQLAMNKHLFLFFAQN